MGLKQRWKKAAMKLTHNIYNYESSFQLSVEKLKPKYSQRPIRTKIYIIINQWEFKAKTSKLLEARENAGDQVAMVFCI